MKRINIPLIALLAFILAAPLSSLAAGADTVTSATPPKAANQAQTTSGPSAFPADKAYTLQEMLTYAIRHAYAAQALYTNALTIDAQAEPFGRLLQEENGLIGQLTALLQENGLAPQEAAAVSGQQPLTSLKEAGLAAIEAKKAGIEMYRAFLSKDTLPDGVRQVFQLLLGSSQSHLDTLMTAAGGEGWLQAAQNEDDRDDDDDDGEHEDSDGVDDSPYQDDDDDDENEEPNDDEDDEDDDDDIEDEGPDDGDDD